MEAVLNKLGQPGRYHCMLVPLIAITWLSLSLGHVAHPFYAYTPKFNCVVAAAGLRNETGFKDSIVISGDQCSYSINSTLGKSTERKCTEWKFGGDADRNGRWINTISTEWNLVCDDRQWAAHSTTFYMSGVIVGAFVFGFLADKFGRKKVLIICLYGQVPVSIAISLQPSFIGYCVLKFILGIFLQGISAVGYIYCVEFFMTKYRGVVFIAFSLVFLSGQGVMTFLSYITNDWRHVQLIASFVCFISAPYLWWIPESPRWLMVHGRKEELINDFIRKACKVNSIDWNSTREFSQKNLKIPSVNDVPTHNNENIKSLAKVPRLLIRLILACYLWLISSLSWYIVLISIGDLAGNHYINYSIGFAVELLMLPLTTYLLFRHTRKPFLMAHYFLFAILCLIAGTVPKQGDEKNLSGYISSKVIIVAALLGKMVISSIMIYIFTYSSELFPTTVRGSCMSFCGVAMRIGTTIAPQFVTLKLYTFDALPFIIIAVMAVLAGIALIPFQETYGKRMPNTIQEALFKDDESINGSQTQSQKHSTIPETRSDLSCEVDGKDTKL